MEHDQKLPQASYSVAENISTVLIPLEVFFFFYINFKYQVSWLFIGYLRYAVLIYNTETPTL